METIGILSDAHGNYGAFELALDILQKEGAEHYYFLGDAVGYIPSIKVVQHLMSMGNLVTCVRGNHEAMLLSKTLDPKRDTIYRLADTRRLMTIEQLQFVEHWPSSRTIHLGESEALMVHGSPTDPTNGYVYPDTDLTPFGSPADYVFMGHSHHPFIRNVNNCCYVNIGSCGLPRDDGRYGAAALFHLSSKKVEVIRFDITGATRNVLQNFPDLHPSVLSVLSRRKEDIYGKIIES